MNFDALRRRVQYRERLLERREAQALQHWDELKQAWRAGWTPWRIVSAGLVAGFLTGRSEPLRGVTGPRVLQMVGAVANLFAGAQAMVAGADDETLPEEPLVDEAFDDEPMPVAPAPAEAATELSER